MTDHSDLVRRLYRHADNATAYAVTGSTASDIREAADAIEQLQAVIDRADALAHVEGLFQGGFRPPTDQSIIDLVKFQDTTIEQLQADLAKAEADAHRLAGRVAAIHPSWQMDEDAEALRLHDERVARRPMMTGIWPKKAGEDTVDLADDEAVAKRNCAN